MRQTRKNLKLYLSAIANWTPTIPASTRIQFASHWSRYLNNWRIDFISTSFEQMNIIKYLSMHLWIYCKIDNLYIKPNFTSLSDVNFATLRSDKILLIIKNSFSIFKSSFSYPETLTHVHCYDLDPKWRVLLVHRIALEVKVSGWLNLKIHDENTVYEPYILSLYVGMVAYQNN